MNDLCGEHSGRRDAGVRQRYDYIMRALPRNQSGEEEISRHACAICAYERGKEHGRKELRELLERLDALIGKFR